MEQTVEQVREALKAEVAKKNAERTAKLRAALLKMRGL